MILPGMPCNLTDFLNIRIIADEHDALIWTNHTKTWKRQLMDGGKSPLAGTVYARNETDVQ